MVGRGFKENNSVMATTIEDVWQILAQVATSQAELTSAQKETDRQLRETDQRQKETAQQQKETDRQLKELGLAEKVKKQGEGINL